MATTIYSLLKHNKDAYFSIYILHNNQITDTDVNWITQQLQFKHLDNFSITLINMENTLKSYGFKNLGKWTKEVYFKIFLPVLLPNVERILFLDADVLVLDSIDVLFEHPLENNLYLGKVKEGNVNCGVLLCNLKKAREINSLNTLLNFINQQIQSNASDYMQAEEYAINRCFENLIVSSDVILNMFNENVSVQNKVIAHFVAIKPWHLDRPIRKSEYKNLYFQYAQCLEEFGCHRVIVAGVFYYSLYGGYYINSIIKRIKNFVYRYIFKAPKYSYIHGSFIMSILKSGCTMK